MEKLPTDVSICCRKEGNKLSTRLRQQTHLWRSCSYRPLKIILCTPHTLLGRLGAFPCKCLVWKMAYSNLCDAGRLKDCENILDVRNDSQLIC